MTGVCGGGGMGRAGGEIWMRWRGWDGTGGDEDETGKEMRSCCFPNQNRKIARIWLMSRTHWIDSSVERKILYSTSLFLISFNYPGFSVNVLDSKTMIYRKK